ncbi:hypothetical protein AYI70_g10932 [Smittium culicis]|uniref:Uncharacterized protein n=1 Tax=Smittium culicis TaxID=133412 RepID=A0A1R1X460_9FUNG|nr:hypothetical protein AYI70_g10932 [Smittium culicis]
MSISFEVLPPKFSGAKEECKSVEARTTGFAEAIAYNNCAAEVSINLLKFWFQEEAANWSLKLQPIVTEKS